MEVKISDYLEESGGFAELRETAKAAVEERFGGEIKSSSVGNLWNCCRRQGSYDGSLGGNAKAEHFGHGDPNRLYRHV